MSNSAKNTLRDISLFFEYKFFYPVISFLPIKVAYKVATIKGIVEGFICQKKLETCSIGIEQGIELNLKECRNIAKAQLRMLSREKMDVFLIPRINEKNVDEIIQFKGLENFSNAKKMGKPVILYTSHFGRLIMPLIALGIKGYPTSPLTAPPHGPRIQVSYLKKKLTLMHSKMQGTFVNTNQSMRHLYKILANDETLIVIVDVPPIPGQIVYEEDFLNGKAKFPKGIVKLAKKMDALLVPYFTLEHQGRLSGEFLPAISATGLEETELLKKIVEPIENNIRKHPEQWWMWPWLYAFWRK